MKVLVTGARGQLAGPVGRADDNDPEGHLGIALGGPRRLRRRQAERAQNASEGQEYEAMPRVSEHSPVS